MPTPDRTNLRHQAIRRTLGQLCAADSGTAAIVQANRALWREVTAQLAPMIGDRGIDAMVSRSMELATPQCPWLGPAGKRIGSLGPLAGFQACLEGCDPPAATEASVALLVAFTDLLAAMIGASLTDRLLDPIWAAPPPGAAKESES